MTHHLLGLYDSPYVRRVAIAMVYYGIPFEHESLSVFRHMEEMRKTNPLLRVPMLTTPDGMRLHESAFILDYLDDVVREAGRDALIPASGVLRRQVWQRVAMGQIAVDKAVVTSSARGAQLLTKETRSVTLGAMASIALQMWYRLPEQENVFPAISEQMGDYMTISADPSKQEDSEANRADNSGASAYLVILGDDFLHSIWGNKKTLSMSPVQEETVARNTEDGESGTMRAYTSRLEGWTGIAVESPFSVARIKNISAQHPLTDKLVAKAKSLFPAALRGMISYVVMNGNVKLLLQESRTLTPATGNGGTGMIAPEPDSVMGIKILEVDSLLDDESLSSVRAAFAEDFFRARRNSLALKN